jgi:hypothetical protein
MEDLDPELQAMAITSKALAALDDNAARTRVLEWLADKFNASTKNSPQNPSIDRDYDNHEPMNGSKNYGEFAELFNAFDPKNDTERVLVAAYWHQVVQNINSWQSLTLNKLLKDTGHGIGKINRVLSNALNKKPAYVLQVTRGGKTKQSRKTYKLTTEGVSFIETRLQSNE